MNKNITANKDRNYMKVLVPIVGVGIILTVVTFALTIAILVKVNKGFDENQNGGLQTTISSTIRTTALTTIPITTTNSIGTTPATTASITTASQASTTSQPSPNATLATSIRIEDVMNYLRELQYIATAESGTRAINTPGFNQTLDYIIETLTANTNYNVKKDFFPVRQFLLARNPIFTSSINGTIQNYTYSNNLSVADFYHVQFSRSVNFPDFVEITVIPDLGCSDADWSAATPPPNGLVALVKRGNCTFAEKAALASEYNVSALLIYNDGTAPDRIQPIYISLGQANTLPALFLSYTLGQQLADAAENTSTELGVLINIAVMNDLPFPVGNICADTPTGNATQTIVIGSHSDSVPAGPGINDNGKLHY
jgi:hypothetical protein